jgi:hypothetical protein
MVQSNAERSIVPWLFRCSTQQPLDSRELIKTSVPVLEQIRKIIPALA